MAVSSPFLAPGIDAMTKHRSKAFFLPATLEPTSTISLHRQLYDALRQAILSGQLTAGTQLPSTRALAEQLGISRTTVVLAFDQLLHEGYVEGKKGSGTYVASMLPEDLLHRSASIDATTTPALKRQKEQQDLSARGKMLAATDVATVQPLQRSSCF